MRLSKAWPAAAARKCELRHMRAAKFGAEWRGASPYAVHHDAGHAAHRGHTLWET